MLFYFKIANLQRYDFLFNLFRFVSISFGDEEDINFNLGPGQADHAVDKLKQLEEALNCEGLACLDVKY